MHLAACWTLSPDFYVYTDILLPLVEMMNNWIIAGRSQLLLQPSIEECLGVFGPVRVLRRSSWRAPKRRGGGCGVGRPEWWEGG